MKDTKNETSFNPVTKLLNRPHQIAVAELPESCDQKCAAREKSTRALAYVARIGPRWPRTWRGSSGGGCAVRAPHEGR